MGRCHQAETLKYFYLLFSPTDVLPLDTIVLNTEAHIFPRSKLIRGMKTGWERKPRKKEGKAERERGSHKEREEESKRSREDEGATETKVEETKGVEGKEKKKALP